jgi:CheY-like chemotaxis protein
MDVAGDDKLAAGVVDLVLTKPPTKEQLLHAIAQVWAAREEKRSCVE